MDNSTIVLLINDNARAVKARYEEGGKEEVFKTLDQTIKADDMIVVESGTRYNMTVVKVTEVDVDVNFDIATNIRWVVQRIDKEAFDSVLSQERAAVSTVQSAERRRKKAELRKALFADHEERIKSLSLANMTDDDILD